MDTTTQTAEQAMRDALAKGGRSDDITYEIKRAYGLTFAQAVDLYHRVTTGRPTPEWAKSGTTAAVLDPTGERRAWERRSTL